MAQGEEPGFNLQYHEKATLFYPLLCYYSTIKYLITSPVTAAFHIKTERKYNTEKMKGSSFNAVINL